VNCVPETAARFYDPTTGQFLSRDPLNAMTRSPYGYVGNNPLNYTDPLGLCWGPGCWAEDAAKGAVGFVGELTGADQQTIARVQGAVESGSDWFGDKITNNPMHDHLGIDANLCVALCIGLTYQDGHFYLNYGIGAVAGAGIGPSYYSQPLDPESCDNSPSIAAMLGPISGSVSRDMESGGFSTDKGWTVSAGWGLKYSLFLGPMWQKAIT
jgi:hypothetical protein